MNCFSLFEKREEKDFKKFCELLVKLQPVEFDGLARLLGVRCSTSEKNEAGETIVTVRSFGDVMEDVFDSFTTMKRKKRKEVLDMMKEATKGAK